MSVNLIVSPSVFEDALRVGRALGEEPYELLGLSAPLDGASVGRLAEAWDVVERALRDSYRRGADWARAGVNAAVEKIEKLLGEAGAKAREIEAALLRKLQEFISRLVDGALELVRESIQVGAFSLTISSVQVQQTIGITGSIKASLQEVCAFASSGQLSVVTSYSAPTTA